MYVRQVYMFLMDPLPELFCQYIKFQENQSFSSILLVLEVGFTVENLYCGPCPGGIEDITPNHPNFFFYWHVHCPCHQNDHIGD